MKATKVSDASFDINLTPSESESVRLQCLNGEICLSLSGLLFNGQGSWYELPIREITSVEIIEDDPVKLKFCTEDMEIIIKGKNNAHLKALRHFLLPFLDQQ